MSGPNRADRNWLTRRTFMSDVSFGYILIELIVTPTG